MDQKLNCDDRPSNVSSISQRISLQPSSSAMSTERYGSECDDVDLLRQHTAAPHPDSNAQKRPAYFPYDNMRSESVTSAQSNPAGVPHTLDSNNEALVGIRVAGGHQIPHISVTSNVPNIDMTGEQISGDLRIGKPSVLPISTSPPKIPRSTLGVRRVADTYVYLNTDLSQHWRGAGIPLSPLQSSGMSGCTSSVTSPLAHVPVVTGMVSTDERVSRGLWGNGQHIAPMVYSNKQPYAQRYSLPTNNVSQPQQYAVGMQDDNARRRSSSPSAMKTPPPQAMGVQQQQQQQMQQQHQQQQQHSQQQTFPQVVQHQRILTQLSTPGTERISQNLQQKWADGETSDWSAVRESRAVPEHPHEYTTPKRPLGGGLYSRMPSKTSHSTGDLTDLMREDSASGSSAKGTIPKKMGADGSSSNHGHSKGANGMPVEGTKMSQSSLDELGLETGSNTTTDRIAYSVRETPQQQAERCERNVGVTNVSFQKHRNVHRRVRSEDFSSQPLFLATNNNGAGIASGREGTPQSTMGSHSKYNTSTASGMSPAGHDDIRVTNVGDAAGVAHPLYHSRYHSPQPQNERDFSNIDKNNNYNANEGFNTDNRVRRCHTALDSQKKIARNVEATHPINSPSATASSTAYTKVTSVAPGPTAAPAPQPFRVRRIADLIAERRAFGTTATAQSPGMRGVYALFGTFERSSQLAEFSGVFRENRRLLEGFVDRVLAKVENLFPAQIDFRKFLFFPQECMINESLLSTSLVSWPLHTLFLASCFYVTAHANGYSNVMRLLQGRGGIFASGKGVFAALAVAMSPNEEQLADNVAKLCRASFAVGKVQAKKEATLQIHLHNCSRRSFSLLLVNIPIMILRLLVEEANKVQYPSDQSGSAKSAQRAAVVIPISKMEVTRVISGRSAIVSGHPLDLERLDMLLARYANATGVRIHKDFLPTTVPENSPYYNQPMPLHLLQEWDDIGFLLNHSDLHVSFYSPVDGQCITQSTPLMETLAGAVTCVPQDLTYSLQHLRDGDVLLDFSAHSLRLGHVIAWTRRKNTVLVEPADHVEESILPSPRRSSRDAFVRATLGKFAIINLVLNSMNWTMPRTNERAYARAMETTFLDMGLLIGGESLLMTKQGRNSIGGADQPSNNGTGVSGGNQYGADKATRDHNRTLSGGTASASGQASTGRRTITAVNAQGSQGYAGNARQGTGKSISTMSSPSSTLAGGVSKLERAGNVPSAAVAASGAGSGASTVDENDTTPNLLSPLSQLPTSEKFAPGSSEVSLTSYPIASPQNHAPQVYAAAQVESNGLFLAAASPIYEPPVDQHQQHQYILSNANGAATWNMGEPHSANKNYSSNADLRGVGSGTYGGTRTLYTQQQQQQQQQRNAPLQHTPVFFHKELILLPSSVSEMVVNVYQVSPLIKYLEMQCQCVLTHAAVHFADNLCKKSGIPFPPHTLLMCPTVFSLLELWDAYEFLHALPTSSDNMEIRWNQHFH